jgi:hypothetical protein
MKLQGPEMTSLTTQGLESEPDWGHLLRPESTSQAIKGVRVLPCPPNVHAGSPLDARSRSPGFSHILPQAIEICYKSLLL